MVKVRHNGKLYGTAIIGYHEGGGATQVDRQIIDALFTMKIETFIADIVAANQGKSDDVVFESAMNRVNEWADDVWGIDTSPRLVRNVESEDRAPKIEPRG